MANRHSMKKKILIIDTKAGNLFSLQAAINRLGFASEILQSPNAIALNDQASAELAFDGVVIPGQGRFGTVMKNLQANNWITYLNQAKQQGLPILGICVGMQVMFESSEEDAGSVGMAWFKGKVERLDFPKKPMVGWAELNSSIWPEAEVYFVNSFAVRSSEITRPNLCAATTTYGEIFCAAIKQDNVIGVQFHPEKSGQQGLKIIEQALSQNFNGFEQSLKVSGQ
jgi:imidazole glycerol-phosphate synthase subunit HisH